MQEEIKRKYPYPEAPPSVHRLAHGVMRVVTERLLSAQPCDEIAVDRLLRAFGLGESEITDG